MVYVGGTTLLADSEVTLKQQLKDVQFYEEVSGAKLNQNKYKRLRLSNGQHTYPQINIHNLTLTETTKYLGLIMESAITQESIINNIQKKMFD